jgi:hypothetical protein
MPIHDAYARVTPFELTLPSRGFADERFPLIEKEAETRGLAVSDPGTFALLSEAGLVLREIRGEEESPQLIRQHGALLFHCFHFWRLDRPLFFLDTEVVRYVVASGPEEGEWAPRLPASAGYVQLPQYLMWAPGGENAVPESLDGFFWSYPSEEAFSVLVVMGLRRDRPGITVVSLPTLPLSAAGPWVSVNVRPEGSDFSSSLPGAEMDGLYSLEAGAEALKLAMRVFWYVDSRPGSLSQADPPGGDADPKPTADPEPTTLPYCRVVLEVGNSREEGEGG